MGYPLVDAISAFIIAALLLIAARPGFAFHEDGTAKTFGSGTDETFLTVPTTATLVGAIALFVLHITNAFAVAAPKTS